MQGVQCQRVAVGVRQRGRIERGRIQRQKKIANLRVVVVLVRCREFGVILFYECAQIDDIGFPGQRKFDGTGAHEHFDIVNAGNGAEENVAGLQYFGCAAIRDVVRLAGQDVCARKSAAGEDACHLLERKHRAIDGLQDFEFQAVYFFAFLLNIHFGDRRIRRQGNLKFQVLKVGFRHIPGIERPRDEQVGKLFNFDRGLKVLVPDQEFLDSGLDGGLPERIFGEGHDLPRQTLEGLADSSIGKILSLRLGQAALLVFFAAAARTLIIAGNFHETVSFCWWMNCRASNGSTSASPPPGDGNSRCSSHEVD